MINNFDADYAKATREAELGFSTCRICNMKDKLSAHITVSFGGGLLFSICVDCVNKGESILIKRTEHGIGILRRPATGVVVAATSRDLNVLNKRLT
jgi:hypothetical protein